MSDTRKTTKPNVPNLRFPGFEGEWDKLKVRDFTRVVAGATPATDKKEYWGGVIRWMNSGELNLKRVYEVQGRITQLGYDKTSTKIIPPHSVLIGLAGQGKTRGTAAMNYVELCTNQSIASILPSDSFYSEFLYQNVESRYKELRDISSGDGGRGGLNLQMIYNLYIPHCSMQEQKKIGDFLYLLDQRIAIQNKVIEKYESLIKALAHEIIGKNAPNTMLSECVCCTSSTLKESDLSDGGAVPAYGAAGISGFIDSALSDGDSILITKDGSGVGSLRYVVGHHSFVGTLNSMTPKEGVYLPYIYYALQNVCFESYRTGQAIPHIYFKDYGKEALYCPSFDDQKRLAKGLEMIDAKIGIERAAIQNLQLVKAYLLSAMFI